ncbi:hypothetical protein BGZ83_004804 [Gryganskiella cystojenkinii]|nr:hypothetical protein BGZ83_004804 [Gryganskiella cystojenkinii]
MWSTYLAQAGFDPHHRTRDVLGLGDNDNAVSRRHIAITIGKPTLETVRTHAAPTKLTVRDLSTHGVDLDRVRIEKSKEVEVEISKSQTWTLDEKRHVAGRGYGGWATVEIGNNTTFRLERVDINICSSGMDRQAKLSILEKAVEIDLKESLNTCWESRGQNSPPILETSYPATVPTEFEDIAVQWEPHFARRALFAGYRFISFHETYTKSLGQLVQCAGGTWSLEDPAKVCSLISQCMNATQKPVFLSPFGESAANVYPVADEMIKKLGYRWVNEDEVGKAVIYASTEIFCNPQYMDALPTHEEMSTMRVSQMPFTQYLGSLASMPAQLTLKKDNSAGDAIDFPQVIDDDDNDDDIWIRPMKRSAVSTSKAALPYRSPAPASPVTASTKSPAAKPPKKKSKTDRMAMFFEGLDDDDTVDLDAPESTAQPTMTQIGAISGSLHMPTAAKPGRHLSSLSTPVPVAWPEVVDLDDEPTGSSNPREKESALSMKNNTVAPDDPTQRVDDEEIDNERQITDTEIDQGSRNSTANAITDVALTEIKPEPQDSSPTSSRSKSSRGTKSATFDAIRGDMEGLQLDIKISRQKDNLDEQQKHLRMGLQRSRHVTGTEGESCLMQSERSIQLLAKNKRRKLLEDQLQSRGEIVLSSAEVVSQGSSSLDRSASVRILEEADKKDWPERWKEKPNFKTRTVLDPVLEVKWKDRPNFKTFRKSTLPGVRSQPREPTPLTLDGKVVEKHESTIEKIGNYFKRESEGSPPPTLRSARKPSEKQMTRDDIKLLLADD